MKLYPKRDIKNLFGDILWHMDKVYKCEKYPNDDEYYIVTCELIGNEYPGFTLEQIKEMFYLEDEYRDTKLNNILK